MKIRLLNSMGIEGEHTPAGTVIETETGFGRYQVSIGRAEEVPENTPLGLPKKGKPAPAEKPAPADKPAAE